MFTWIKALLISLVCISAIALLIFMDDELLSLFTAIPLLFWALMLSIKIAWYSYPKKINNDFDNQNKSFANKVVDER